MDWHLRALEVQLKRELAQHLCGILDGWTQAQITGLTPLTQAEVSALRRGRTYRFSVGRLLRVIARQHYDIELHLRRIRQPFKRPRRGPSVTVMRYDRFGRQVK
jgi:predicted XRE-type DNA-binding protein